LLDRQGPTYHGGPAFIRMAQQIDQNIPNYRQLLDQRAGQGQSTSRRDFYWDIFKALNDEQKLQFFRIFIAELEPHAKDEVQDIRAIVFGGGFAVPLAMVPLDSWNSAKLNNSLKDIDHAIDAQQFNRAVTLAYTCLEGLYKSYVRKHVVAKADLTDLIQLCRVVKDDIAQKLRARGPFPMEIVNAIPTLTNAVANSRNSFSESHFADDANKWLAIFARDMTNSIGRLLLHFI
ncbi:MAG: hypothetical protein EON54_17500, partial [Alcaligenaceae bacterium]